MSRGQVSILLLNSFFLFFQVSGLALGAASETLPSSLDFSLTPEGVASQCQKSLNKADGRFKDLANVETTQRSFENTVVTFDRVLFDLFDATAAATFLKYVSTQSVVREASHECEAKVETFSSVEVYSREDLYRAFKTYADQKPSLNLIDAKLLNKILLEFKKNGFGLGSRERKKIKKFKKELIGLELAFGKNLNEVKDYLAVSGEEIEGLPSDFVARLERLDGRYKVTLDYPDYFPFMRNAKSEEARQKLEFKYNNRAVKENIKILKKVLKIRSQIAQILGYPTHAHLVLEDRMAKDPQKVFVFLNRLRGRLRAGGLAELALMSDLKKKEESLAGDGKIAAWDFGYYDNALKKTQYQVDDESIKEYFPLDIVTQGMLDIYQELFDLRFEEAKDAQVWHPDVKLFAVHDKTSGELLGRFFMDLFPREGKYKHAAAFTLISGRRLPDDAYEQPVSAIVANFNKPTKDAPSLLKHAEVETYFHEFGHIMHQVLTKAPYGWFSGTHVARDFVEAPSQMLENWVWKEETLKKLSGHYKDPSKKLPDEMLKRMIEAKNLNAGVRYLTQVFYATIDMAYHTNKDVGDTTELYGRLKTNIVMIPMSKGTHPEASFGHLMGYDAAYYGYLWSEVFAQDMFTRFEVEGLLNPEIGKKYRRLILEPGGSLDELEQLKAFLGREPNDEAFLKSIGL